MIEKMRQWGRDWQQYKEKSKKKSTSYGLFLEGVETLGVALVFALLIKEFIVQVSVVPTGSMIPTLIGGVPDRFNDRLFVNKYVYDFSSPERGDIVVFRSPHDDGKDYVKRCIGLPNEVVEIKRGLVYINGKQLVLVGVDVQEDFSFFGPVTVPEGQYFVLGDNRAYSRDSRYWGFVSEDDLLGKAFFTFWPFTRMKVLK